MVEKAVDKAVSHVTSMNNEVDIVVHNVGGSFEIDDPFAPVAEWLKVCQFNCGIALEFNNLLIPPMMESNWGRIVMISSMDADLKIASPLYGAAKAYLNRAHSKSLKPLKIKE